MEAIIKREYVIGLDLGHLHDYTALVILERFMRIKEIGGKKIRMPSFLERQSRRFELPTSSETVIKDVLDIIRALEPLGRVKLCVDRTGIGLPTFQLFESYLPLDKLIGIVFGKRDTEETRHGHVWYVPKINLESAVALVIEQDRLRISKEYPASITLFKELRDYVPSAARRGDTQDVPWREKEHDDLVFALACAVWWGLRNEFVPHGLGTDGVWRPLYLDPWETGGEVKTGVSGDEVGILSARAQGKTIFEIEREFLRNERIRKIYEDEKEENNN